jgi:hypothetical protein
LYSAGTLSSSSSSSSSSSLDESDFSATFSLRSDGAATALPPNRPNDFAWPSMYPATPANMAHAAAMFAVEGCAFSCIVMTVSESLILDDGLS